MDIPKSFKPENKALDEKLEQLKKEASLKTETEKELNEILTRIRNRTRTNLDMELDGKIQEIIEEKGYTKLLFPDIDYPIYWAKSHNKEQTKVLIQKIDSKEILVRYSFTIVDNNKLRDFCREFKSIEDYHLLNLSDPTKLTNNSGALAIAVGTGFITNSLLPYLGVLPPSNNAMAIIAGLVSYVFGGILLDYRSRKKRQKKEAELYKNIITEDTLAIEEALK